MIEMYNPVMKEEVDRQEIMRKKHQTQKLKKQKDNVIFTFIFSLRLFDQR